MNQDLLRELNENIKKLMSPKKVCRTDEEKATEYGNRIVKKYAKRNLKP